MIQVTMLDTVELATYSVRTFALYKVKAVTVAFPPFMLSSALISLPPFSILFFSSVVIILN